MGQRSVGFSFKMRSDKGPLYLQHIGCDVTFGDAVAVYADAALSDYRFSILFPVEVAARRKIVSRLDRREVPERYKPLRFKYPIGAQTNGQWMIVENGGQYKVENLSPEQVSFVLAFALNETALAELFHAGWTETKPFPILTS